jgi:hypothetical protein
VRPQLCEINHSSAIWLHSFVFLLVFSIRRQGLSLLGEVDRATPVDNQRSRGAAIAGFRAELFGSRIELCRDSTKSRVIRTFRKIGNPSSHHKAYEGYVQKMGLIGPMSPIGRRVNFGQLISNLAWVGETRCSSALSHEIHFVLSLDGECASPID